MQRFGNLLGGFGIIARKDVAGGLILNISDDKISVSCIESRYMILS
jgi:hypothetical protein